MTAHYTALAKTTPPQLPRAIARESLQRRLAALPTRALWLHGAPGSGKSVLIGMTVASQRQPFLWYRLGAEDQEPARFFAGLTQAAAACTGRRRPKLPAYHADQELDVATFAREFFAGLLSFLPVGTAVVLDDVHHLTRTEGMAEALAALIATPAAGRLFLISREPPPSACARAQVHGELTVISGAELKVSATELAAIAQASGLEVPTPERLAALIAASDGWMAGAILLLRADSAGGEAGVASGELLFDYFMTQVFADFEPRVQRLLLCLALLPVIERRAAEALAGDLQVALVLDELHRRCFFVDCLRPGDAWRLHPLFQRFLEWQARRTLPAERLQALLRQAAPLLERQGELDRAMALYHELDDHDALARTIRQHADDLLRNQLYRPLQHWLALLPEEQRRTDPWLAYWQGQSLLPFQPAQARRWFELAWQGFDRAGEALGRLRAWCGVVEGHLHAWDTFHTLLPWLDIDNGAADVGLNPRLLRWRIRAQVLLLAGLLFCRPTDPRLPALAGQLRNLLALPFDYEMRLRAAIPLLRYYLWKGEFADATVVIERLRRGAQREVSPLAALSWHHVEAFYLWFTHPEEGIDQAVERGLAVAERSGIRMLNLPLLAQGAYGALGAGDRAAAARYIELMRPLLRPERLLDSSHFDGLAAWAAAQRGEPAKALAHGRSAVELAEAAGTPFPLALAQLIYGHTLYAAGRLDEARTQTESALAFAERMPSYNMQYVARLDLAALALAEGDRPAALRELHAAFALGRRWGLQTAVWWQPEGLAALCAEALAAGIETDFVRAVIRTRRLAPPADAGRDWPYPVRIVCHDGFHVEVDGHPPAAGRKAQQKPLELLRLLAARPEGWLGREQVMDRLWPEADGDAAAASLNTTLHRLRRLLGRDEAILLQDGTVALNPAVCSWDTHWIERDLATLSAALIEERPPALWQAALERLIDSYRRPLLAGFEDAWIEAERERSRRRYLGVLAPTLERLVAAGERARAAQLALTALRGEPAADALFTRLTDTAPRSDN